MRIFKTIFDKIEEIDKEILKEEIRFTKKLSELKAKRNAIIENNKVKLK